MTIFNLNSSAPHIRQASTIDTGLDDWGPQPDCRDGTSHSTGKLLFKDSQVPIEAGMWRCTPGRWPLEIPHDELCYFTAGSVTYTSSTGQVIEVVPDTLVHFPAGWKGEAVVHEKLFNTYMLCPGGPDAEAKVLFGASQLEPEKDWGEIPTMVEGSSRTSGNLLYRHSSGRAESGLWNCTPGTWECHVTSHELCHFLLGRCTYEHESGEVIEVVPDTFAFFPKDWKGTCTVHETVRKAYMIA